MHITSSMAAKNKLKKKKEIISCCLFFVYLGVLFYFLFFAKMFGRDVVSDDYRYNLTLFHEIRRYIRNVGTIGLEIFAINLLGNIVVFMPFGIFVPLLEEKKRGIIFTTIVTALFSFVIETIQLVTKHGSFDVDDIVLNTLGGMLGFLLYVLWNKVKGKKQNGIRKKKT